MMIWRAKPQIKSYKVYIVAIKGLRKIHTSRKITIEIIAPFFCMLYLHYLYELRDHIDFSSAEVQSDSVM